MSITAEYLKKAIIGESNAINKYRKFGEVATKEGFPNVAYLFTALISAEEIHVNNHQRALKEAPPEIVLDDFLPQNTQANVQTAIAGEMYEYKEMYPDFLRKIKKERKTLYGKVGSLSMEWAREVELSHAIALEIALEAVKLSKDLDAEQIWICKVCGNLVISDGRPQETCPVCKHDPHFYLEVQRNV
ncbi:MAG: rubrerythrin family protein [Promethearchaeota archaeon]